MMATCPTCGVVEVEAEWEPGEMYGSDADGHRGVWHEGYWYADCPVCGTAVVLDLPEEEHDDDR